jgi:diguanylate cyclase (GGDEF)-like protein
MVVAATVVIVTVAIHKHEEAFFLAAEKAATGLTRSLALQVNRSSQPMHQDVMDNIALFPNIVYAKHINGNAEILHEYMSRYDASKIGLAKAALATISNINQPGAHYFDTFVVTVAAIDFDSSDKHALIVVSDTSQPLQSARANLFWGLTPFLALITAVFMLVTIWLLGRVTSPLLKLCEFTRKVEEEGDYSLRIEAQGSQEFRQLEHNINRLMDTISSELAKNERNTKDLLVQQKAMAKLANYDSLTGLPNRQFVMDNLKFDLARAKRAQQNISLLFFDLDGFKHVNDTLGHETGDNLLIAVAKRVQQVLREGDLIARLGGDEFLIVPDRSLANSTHEAVELSRRLLKAFEQAFEVENVDLQVGLSIGIANADQANYELNELVSNADIAMYRSKANGRGRYTIFSPDMVGDNKRKLLISNSIMTSLEAGHFRLVFQPKVSASGSLNGFEALMRWHHPSLGEISPNDFIPIAESGGNIHALTHWLLDNVCQQVKALVDLTHDKIKVSLNLSAHDLHNQELFSKISESLSRHHLSAKYLEIEVTESALLESFVVSNSLFKKLSSLGCSIALDDFGTGYSSLSYLTQMRIDKLKIDRQFVQKLDSSERSRLVTRTIIDLAKRLDLDTCAEGIENEAQQEYLLNYGCNEFQGFYYGEPQPIDSLEGMLNKMSSRF